MSDMPKRIWAGPYEPSDGFMGGQYCNGYEGMSYATEYIRADIAEQREAELLDALQELVDDDYASRRPEHYQRTSKARAILAKHEQEKYGDGS